MEHSAELKPWVTVCLFFSPVQTWFLVLHCRTPDEMRRVKTKQLPQTLCLVQICTVCKVHIYNFYLDEYTQVNNFVLFENYQEEGCVSFHAFCLKQNLTSSIFFEMLNRETWTIRSFSTDRIDYRPDRHVNMNNQSHIMEGSGINGR